MGQVVVMAGSSESNWSHASYTKWQIVPSDFQGISGTGNEELV